MTKYLNYDNASSHESLPNTECISCGSFLFILYLNQGRAIEIKYLYSQGVLVTMAAKLNQTFHTQTQTKADDIDT